MSSKVKQIVEKYLTGYNLKGHTEEVFVNPTKQEMRELIRASDSSVGVIMDRKNNKIYAFSRDRQIHQQVWRRIHPTGDERKLYDTEELLTAEWDIQGERWNYSSQGIFTDDIITLRGIIHADWSFFKKWIPSISSDVKKI